ncbi:MAG TPA: hypothetical protein VG455_11365 [Acidimicrobiales bacterium]|nr:hypothetical protein [Acidimicrobiales bacterium]
MTIAAAADVLQATNRLINATFTFVEEYPERATRELRAAVAEYKALVDDYTAELAEPERSTCRRCEHPILRLADDGWIHETGERGCRAASFSRLGGRWDDSLDRSWVAAPEKS